MRRHSFELASVDLSPGTITRYDCVVIATDHDVVGYEQLEEFAQLIVDARGRDRDSGENIVRA